MPIGWVAAAGAVASLAGSAMQADAATSAADTQAQATRDAANRLQANYGMVSPYFSPYTQIGQEGVSALSSMLPSLTTGPSTLGNFPLYNTAANPVYQQYPAYKPFTSADLSSNLAPNYEFVKQQGLGASAQKLNVAGGGSNINRAATKFAEDYASNAFQNALENYKTQQQQGFTQNLTGQGQRFNQGLVGQNQLYNQYVQGQQQQFLQQTANQTNIYNRLKGIADLGFSGVSGLSNLATGNATNIANLGVMGATAQAAGQVGSANAYASGINNAANYGSLYGLLRNRNTGNVTGTTGSDTSLPYYSGSLSASDLADWNATVGQG